MYMKSRCQGALSCIVHANASPIIGSVSGEEWRVEVELDDEQHGYSLGERLRALDLDDEARKRLGRRVIVTRDGSKVFLYTSTEDEANEAARVVRELVSADRLTAETRTTRWHPMEEAWEDASVPLPRTEAERAVELEQRDQREQREVEAGGEYDWRVDVRAPHRVHAAALEERLRELGLPVERRWRYLTIGALNEERAGELAAAIRDELPEAEVHIEPHLEMPSPLFIMVRSRL
jgi:hypothetical protein